MISAQDILKGSPPSLAKAITLTESGLESDRRQAQKLMEEILPHAGKSVRLGLSGPPGVGKSTFIENFGLMLIELGKKVAVLAVDPSSPVSGGSLLGDKTRMARLGQSPRAFIRPSPARGAQGGIAARTRESILLCEASGFDVVLVETVGVGQSEFDLHSMVDFFAILIPPNAGDELQGMKKGVLELAHLVVVNKADGELLKFARQTVAQYQSALNLADGGESFWRPPVLSCSALENRGLAEIWEAVGQFVQKSKKQGRFLKNRKLQEQAWIEQMVFNFLRREIPASATYKSELQKALDGKSSPYQAAQAILRNYSKGGILPK